MKSCRHGICAGKGRSRPARGGWIEMDSKAELAQIKTVVSPREGRVD